MVNSRKRALWEMGGRGKEQRVSLYPWFLYSVLVLYYFTMSIYCMLFLKQCKKESQNKTKICYISKKKKRAEKKAIPSDFFKGLLWCVW